MESSAPSSKEYAPLLVKDKMTNNEIITDFDNLYKAFKRSRKNRSYKKSALYFSLNAKEYLKYCVACIEEFLKTLKLKLNPKSQLIKLTAGISFVGFRFYPNGRITLDNGKKRAYKRKFNKLCKKVSKGKMDLKTLEKSYHSWKTHASFATDISFNYFEERLNQLRKKGKHGKLLH